MAPVSSDSRRTAASSSSELDRVELRGRFVEQQEVRLRGDDGGEGHLLQLAARERRQRRVAQVREAERDQRLLDEARDGAALDAEVLEAEGDLALDGRHDRLALRVLEDEADAAREVVRPGVAGVVLVDRHAAGEDAAVEVRHESVEGSAAVSTCRCPSRPPRGSTSAGSMRSETSRSAGRARVRIGVGHVLERRWLIARHWS